MHWFFVHKITTKTLAQLRSELLELPHNVILLSDGDLRSLAHSFLRDKDTHYSKTCTIEVGSSYTMGTDETKSLHISKITHG